MKLNLPTWKTGDKLKAADMNILVAALNRLANLKVTGPALNLTETADGLLITATPGTEVRRAVTTSGISAGTATQAGAGTVRLQSLNPATGAISTLTTQDIKVWNPFLTAIATGTMVLVTHTNGVWMITGANCS